MTSRPDVGDLVKINRAARVIGESPLYGTIIAIKQRYWDYGGGECGFADIADVMTSDGTVQIAISFLELT